MCNSVNLKPGGIIEPLLKIVNVLHMRPGLGIAHSDQLAQTLVNSYCDIGKMNMCFYTHNIGIAHMFPSDVTVP